MKRSLAPGFSPYAFVNGFGDFKWRGMRTQGGSGTNQPNQPRLVMNARFRAGDIVSRPPLKKALSSQAGTCIIGLDDPQGPPIRLWCAVNACPVGFGGTICTYSPEQSPELQMYAKYINANDQVLTLEKFDGEVFVGQGSHLRKIQPYPIPYGSFGASVGGISDIILYEIPGYNVSCMRAFDGKLFIGLDAGAGASKIIYYDGASFYEDLTAINVPTSMGVARENLIVGFGTATNAIKIRSAGAAPGVYAAVAPGAGTVAAYSSGNSIVEWRDAVWIADGGANLWKYDWTTLAIARTPTSATQVRSVAAANGSLYYAYNTIGAARIGEYDAVTFTDVIKDLTLQFANDSVIYTLSEFQNSLFAGMAGTVSVGGNYGPKIFASVGKDFTTAWYGVGSSSAPSASTGCTSMALR